VLTTVTSRGKLAETAGAFGLELHTHSPMTLIPNFSPITIAVTLEDSQCRILLFQNIKHFKVLNDS